MLRRSLQRPLLQSTGARYASSVDKAFLVQQTAARNVFSSDVATSGVEKYLKLNFDKTYAQSYTQEEVAEHLFGFMIADAAAAASNTFTFKQEQTDSAFYFCDSTFSAQINTLKQVDAFIKERNPTGVRATSIRSYHGSSSSVVLFDVRITDFTSAVDDNVTDINAVASARFLRHRSDEAKARYQELIVRLQTSVTSVYSIAPSEGGQVALSWAFTADRLSYFTLLTSLIHEIDGAVVTKKFMETFANGSHVYTFYITGATAAQIEAKATLISFLPNRPSDPVSNIQLNRITDYQQLFDGFDIKGAGKIPLSALSRAVQAIGIQLSADEIKTISEQVETKEAGFLDFESFNKLLKDRYTFSSEHIIFAGALSMFSYYFTPPPVTEDYTNILNIVAKEPLGKNRLQSLRNTLSQEMMSEQHIGTLMAENFDIVKKVFDDFAAGSTAEQRQAIRNEFHARFKAQDRPKQDVAIFESFLRFNECVLKHNFFKVNKAALAFRLDPAKFIQGLDYPRVPHGIFMFVSGQWRGFHVRFTDIARGGVRMILSKPNKYKQNKRTVFNENYNLANTQLMKNKDIPEGGSKGTILVSPRYATEFKENKCRLLFLQYVDALLDVIIPNTPSVVDNYKTEEIIFLGPDENTAGTFPKDGALYSKMRGYSAWKSFTTGKDPYLGGIPHDTYGMTTRSVRVCVEGIYEKLGMQEETLTKFQTGGPDGDLGSNEILRSKEKYIGLVDISGVVYDPAGVNKAELIRLAKMRLRLDSFDATKLSSRGFVVKSKDNNVKLPDGTIVTDGAAFRDSFHFSPLINTDVFIPCGGRPAAVTLQNVHMFINLPDIKGDKMLAGEYDIPKSALKFKVIVEGANLFITQDARLALERCGVVLIKDSTANKGGVTSSSLEVFTGLALSDEEHGRLMSAKSEKDAPQFYKDIVEEICARVEHNARREFDAIWREFELSPKTPKAIITDDLSRKIVEIRQHILNSNLFDDKNFMRYVINQYAPNTLKYTVPVDTIIQRVPDKYLRAIGAIFLASDYVYTKGSSGNEFDFFQSMRHHFENSRKK